MTDRDRSSPLVPILLGILAAGVVLLAIAWLGGGGGGDGTAATTTATTAAPTTSAGSGSTNTTGTTGGTTTTTVAPTSTAATTTSTACAFAGDTTTKTGTYTGAGGNLTDVRVGDHACFVRIVFDLTGAGDPEYTVGYEAGPTFTGSGGGVEVTPDGDHFLRVHVYPVLTYDVNTFALTYTGPGAFDPGYDPVAEIAILDDFEADMQWVIGLDGEHPFTVEILHAPLRLVIDIAK